MHSWTFILYFPSKAMFVFLFLGMSKLFLHHNRYSVFPGLTIHRIWRLLKCLGFRQMASCSWRLSCSWYSWTLSSDRSNRRCSFSATDSKSVLLDVMSCRNTYCIAYWLHQLLMFYLQHYCFVNLIFYLYEHRVFVETVSFNSDESPRCCSFYKYEFRYSIHV